MLNQSRFLLRARFFVALPVCLLLAAGCSKSPDTSSAPPSASSGIPIDNPGGGPGGPGGGMRGGGGPGKPVAENASGAEIYQAKCNCHGPEGKGGRAPVLTGGAGHADSELTTIIHNGKGKMPAFGTQLTDAQIQKVVARIKQFK